MMAEPKPESEWILVSLQGPEYVTDPEYVEYVFDFLEVCKEWPRGQITLSGLPRENWGQIPKRFMIASNGAATPSHVEIQEAYSNGRYWIPNSKDSTAFKMFSIRYRREKAAVGRIAAKLKEIYEMLAELGVVPT